MDNVISAEVWNFFIERRARDEEDVEAEKSKVSSMEWYVQVKELGAKLIRSTVSTSSKCEVLIKIPLMTRVFQLKIRKTADFPEESPSFSGDFSDGFDTFEWKSSTSTLVELTEQFTDFCQGVDAVILEIQEAEHDGFIREGGVEIDEDESGHLWVKMRAENHENEIVELSVDIEDYQSFPRVLRCSNPERTASFDCEKWISEDKLSTNLRRLFGEEEKPLAVIDDVVREQKDSFDDDEIMDFI